MPSKTAAVFLGVLFFAVLAWASWFFRYDVRIVASPDGYGAAYRVDRWSGELRFIEEDQWYPVVEGNPDELQDSLNSKKPSHL
ncbi:MAG: hypothetical protein HQK81_09105 [Desulfovibrionaceae bacterium]|nr:hypothetical protein [Desulfovibrionaceae bacterium]MBF0514202.1 hypothetical protein [Desulfovibrionaceae bacterium]